MSLTRHIELLGQMGSARKPEKNELNLKTINCKWWNNMRTLWRLGESVFNITDLGQNSVTDHLGNGNEIRIQ
jgi:hypothetical protein